MATSHNTSPDRRKDPRIAVKNCILDLNQKFGRIIDISASGLSFYYADRQPWPEYLETTRGTLCPETIRPIRNLPVQTVSDFALPNKFPPGSITVRRRSIRFGELSYMQREKLAAFIHQLTINTSIDATFLRTAHRAPR
ncbi:MAG: hypothetical protein OEV73_11715 [Desulfobulbaceae bacterium]|nr:hypothetical protein [Desulfobulbaceae bacterium]